MRAAVFRVTPLGQAEPVVDPSSLGSGESPAGDQLPGRGVGYGDGSERAEIAGQSLQRPGGAAEPRRSSTATWVA